MKNDLVRLMPSLIIFLYGGALCIVLPIYMYLGDAVERLLTAAGIVLLMTGVFIFFHRKTTNNFEKISVEIEGILHFNDISNKTGLVDISILSPCNFDVLSDKVLPSKVVNIICDSFFANKEFFNFIEYICKIGISKNTKIKLIISEYAPNEIDDNRFLSYKTTSRANWIRHDYGETVSINFMKDPLPQALIWSDRYAIISILNSKIDVDSMVVLVDNKSEIYSKMHKYFELLWSKSSQAIHDNKD